LAEDQKALVRCKGDFVVAVESSAVVDPSVGAFDDPASRLDSEPAVGFGTGHDVEADAGSGGRLGDGCAGVALVQPDVGDGRCDPFRLPEEFREGGSVLDVGLR
jgi:hypothetical protein